MHWRRKWQPTPVFLPRDGGARWAAVCGVAQSWTRLKRLSSSSSNLGVTDIQHFPLRSNSLCFLKNYKSNAFNHLSTPRYFPNRTRDVYPHENWYMNVLSNFFFIIAPKWKQRKCWLVDKWITKCDKPICWNIIQP